MSSRRSASTLRADTRLPWLRLAGDLPEYDDWGPDV